MNLSNSRERKQSSNPRKKKGASKSARVQRGGNVLKTERRSAAGKKGGVTKAGAAWVGGRRCSDIAEEKDFRIYDHECRSENRMLGPARSGEAEEQIVPLA